jgi:hypothetical protein
VPATELDLELERLKIRAEEMRIAAELTRVELQKNPDWEIDVDAKYQADFVGEMFLRVLAHVREEVTYTWED